jgi:glycosyltransferase involved in cell wall biosynthesis
VLEWSAAAYSELVRQGLQQFDIISAPIWDVEGLVTMLMVPEKVVTSLHTTYAIALPLKPDWGQRPSYVRNHINPIIAAEKWVFENGEQFMANSQSILKEIDTLYDSDLTGQSIIVPHGVADVPHVIDHQPSVRSVKKVLFVGRQEYRKGFDTAISAAIKVCTSIPNVVFTFVGSACPSDSHSTIAISMIPQQMLGSRIIITGHVDDDILDNYYRECDIFMAPSRYESFGLIAIEAMRYSKAVIAGDCGGLAEIIDHGENGLLINPDDVASLESSLLALVADEDLALRLSLNARRTFLLSYTLPKMRDNAVIAYRAMINRKSKPTKQIH